MPGTSAQALGDASYGRGQRLETSLVASTGLSALSLELDRERRELFRDRTVLRAAFEALVGLVERCR